MTAEITGPGDAMCQESQVLPSARCSNHQLPRECTPSVFYNQRVQVLKSVCDFYRAISHLQHSYSQSQQGGGLRGLAQRGAAMKPPRGPAHRPAATAASGAARHSPRSRTGVRRAGPGPPPDPASRPFCGSRLTGPGPGDTSDTRDKRDTTQHERASRSRRARRASPRCQATGSSPRRGPAAVLLSPAVGSALSLVVRALRSAPIERPLPLPRSHWRAALWPRRVTFSHHSPRLLLRPPGGRRAGPMRRQP